MTIDNSQKYQFKYVKFSEIINKNISNKVIDQARKSCDLEALATCPDIYNEFPVFFCIVDKNNEVVSSHKVFPDLVFFNDMHQQWAWPADTFTDENFRRRGHASNLVRESTELLHSKNIGRGMVFSNEITLSIHSNNGGKYLGSANRFLLLRTIRPVLDVYKINKFIKNIISKSVKQIFKIYDSAMLNQFKKQKIYYNKYSENEYNVLKPKFIDRETSKKYKFNENLNKILWKISVSKSNSKNDINLFVVYKKIDNSPIGYFVLREKYQDKPMGRIFKNFKLTTLMDYGIFCESKASFRGILYCAVKEFIENDGEVFEIISNDEKVKPLLRKMFFIRGGRGMSFALSLPPSWALPVEHLDINSWQLTHFTGDGFSF